MYLTNRSTLSELQPEVVAWADRNFDRTVVDHPLLGMIEEVGELARGVLKSEQNIRGTKEQHEEAMLDAIGDISVYLMDFADRADAELVDPTDLEYNEGGLTHNVFELSVDLGALVDSYIVSGHVDLEPVIYRLIQISMSLDYDYYEIVEDTWERVSKRDWVANPVTGTG